MIELGEPKTVSELSLEIKKLLEGHEAFQDVYLRGEVSNYRRYPSGHAYFTLKDDKSVISAVMWNSSFHRVSFNPKDGDLVDVIGSVAVYPPQGRYQIVCAAMRLAGQGEKLLRLQELRNKLLKEGLFDASRKRKLPQFPQRVGIITAKGGAAIKDLVFNLQKRWPLSDIIAFPSLVQGKEAPKDLLRALTLSKDYALDVLIIGRGGGSSEDLDAFNDETLVRALSSYPCPTISAVGHEINESLTDLVADCKVSTPTGAAIAAVPDKENIRQGIDGLYESATLHLRRKLSFLREKLEFFKQRPFFLNPASAYTKRIEEIEALRARMDLGIAHILSNKRQRLDSSRGRLNALSPYGVLDRGYSILTDEGGSVVKSIEDVKVGSTVVSRLGDGALYSKVERKEK